MFMVFSPDLTIIVLVLIKDKLNVIKRKRERERFFNTQVERLGGNHVIFELTLIIHFRK